MRGGAGSRDALFRFKTSLDLDGGPVFYDITDQSFLDHKTRGFLRVCSVREGSWCKIGVEGYAALDSTALRGLLGVPAVR